MTVDLRCLCRLFLSYMNTMALTEGPVVPRETLLFVGGVFSLKTVRQTRNNFSNQREPLSLSGLTGGNRYRPCLLPSDLFQSSGPGPRLGEWWRSEPFQESKQ